jgi:hypothetical protein
MTLKQLHEEIEARKDLWGRSAEVHRRAAAEARGKADAAEGLARDAAARNGIPVQAVAVELARAPRDREADAHEVAAKKESRWASASQGRIRLGDEDRRDAGYMRQIQPIVGAVIRAHAHEP